jgi:hypothetical protein
MKKLVLLFAIVALVPDPAIAACHHFSRWAFPFPQRCHVFASVPRDGLKYPLPPQRERIDIPVPDLSNIDWGKTGDDSLRGLALLRSLYNGP